MAGSKTVFRVKLRLASFGENGLVWQRLLVDRPSAEEASELIKWAHRLDAANALVRPHDQNCSVEKKKVSDESPAPPPLAQVIGSLEEAFCLRKPR